MERTKNELQGNTNIKQYILAGHAGFRIHNKLTGKSVIFRITRDRKKKIFFISAIVSEETLNYSKFIGTIFENMEFKYGRKAKLPETSTEVVAFKWFWNLIITEEPFPSKCKITHFGRCGACGRPLEDDYSVEHGLGPVCYKRIKVKTSAK